MKWNLDLYEDCKEVLINRGVEKSDIFMPEDIEIIPCNNELERLGIMVKANEFITSFTYFEEETFQETYDSLNGERNGRFDCNDNYPINDDYYAGSFVHVGDVSYAEIWSRENDCTVAYVRM